MVIVKSKSWRKPEDRKPFKGSKRKSSSKAKGRTQAKQAGPASAKALCKADRKNAAKVAQKSKRLELVEKARLFKGAHGAPRVVLVVALSPQLESSDVVRKLTNSTSKQQGSVQFWSERHGTNILYVPCERKLLCILRLAAAADYVMLAVSETLVNDAWSQQLQSALRAQGLPMVLPVIQLNEASSPKAQQSAMKAWHEYFEAHYPALATSKLLSVDSASDCCEVERTIAQRQLKPICWRDAHPYMLTPDYSFHADSDQDSVGLLRIKGFIRGKPFSANQMVHLSQLGDFYVDKIELHSSPSPGHAQAAMAVELTQFCETPRVRTPLLAPDDCCNMDMAPVLLAGENATSAVFEAPFQQAEQGSAKTSRAGPIARISSYQAAWIPADKLDKDEIVASSGSESSMDSEAQPEAERYQATTMGGQDDLDAMEVEKELEAYRQNKLAASRDDLAWPDEIELLPEIPARSRLHKYQAVKSLRHGVWDEHDRLPSAYASLCQFQDYKCSCRRALSSAAYESPFEVGQCVTLHVPCVPRACYEALKAKAQPIVCFGLLHYEDQASVLHFTVDRSASYQEPIENKESFVLLMGYRLLQAAPLFSELSRGQLHKMHRFLPEDTISVGSIYGSIQFGDPPALLFKTEVNFPDGLSYAEEPVVLCSTGSLLSMDPSRCILKRITLTGDPFKIHKNSAVIRHMFFNPEDVKYFQPVQLATKSGRVGHIKESLGTHGYMKCTFDRTIQQQDSVCLHLYKRVFPKSLATLYTLL